MGKSIVISSPFLGVEISFVSDEDGRFPTAFDSPSTCALQLAADEC